MTLRWIAGLVLLFIVASVPWWFGGEGESVRLFGMPVWAIYSMLVTLAFAIVTAWLLAKRWDLLERGEQRDPGSGHD